MAEGKLFHRFHVRNATWYCQLVYPSTFVLYVHFPNSSFNFLVPADAYVLLRVLVHQRGGIYSLDESRRDTWATKLREHIEQLQTGKGESGKKYSYRYIGSVVADVHRTLVSYVVSLRAGVDGAPTTQREVLY